MTTSILSPVTRVRKAVLAAGVVLALVAGVMTIFTLVRPASADEYEARIQALQADMAQYQAEADRLNAEALTLQNAVAQLANEKRALQAQVDLSQAEYDRLVVQIAETEQKIKTSQDLLGETLADLYVDDTISSIEMLASSENIGSFLDKQEFRNAIRDEMNSTIKTVRTLKEELSDKKQEVERVLTQQKAARDSLAAKESEQRSLLAATQNDEAEYQALIKDSEAEIAAARAAQAAIRARANQTGGVILVDGGLLSDYPWNTSNCWMVGYMSEGGADGNGGDGKGYGCRQCVSYAAWRIAKETGYYYTDLGNGGSVGHSLLTKHAQHGYTNLGTTPQAGSVAMLWGTTSAPYSSNYSPGHVAWVEAVSADGSQVLVSQYNYNYGAGYGMYSKMWLSTGFFDQYVKVK